MRTRSVLIGAGVGAVAGLAYALARRREAQAAPLLPAPPLRPTLPGVPMPQPPQKPPYVPPPSTGPTKPVAVPPGEGPAFFDALSQTPLVRTQQLYEAVRQKKQAGMIDVPTADVEVSDDRGNHGVVTVTNDAVRLYGVRFSVDTYYAQWFADLFGAMLMTQKVADEMWKAAKFKLTPTTLPTIGETTETMATTRAMLKASAAVDAQLAARGFDAKADYNEIVGNPGKDWLLSAWYWLPGRNTAHCATKGMQSSVENLHSGVNYGLFGAGGGLYSPTGHGVSVIQGAANCHDYHHTDYSQVLRLIAGTMVVNGEEMSTADVIASPEYAGLLSYEGPLPGARHPGVPIDPGVGGITV